MADEKKSEKLELNDKELNKVSGGYLHISNDFTCFICKRTYTIKFGETKLVDGNPRTVCKSCGKGLESFDPTKTSERCYFCGSYMVNSTLRIEGVRYPICRMCIYGRG